jgi:phthiocerol/phenolphthiocerol synthesis type-I polyketide synthase E
VARVLHPKVTGTVTLWEALAGRPVDFLALFSSAVVALGGLGESDYCAANAFLGAFAASVGRDGGPAVVTVDWGPWQRDAWQAAALSGLPELRARMRALRDEYGLTDDEGADLFDRILAAALPEALVVPQDLDAFVEEWRNTATLDALVPAAPQDARYPRPSLRTPYHAPRDETERAIAEVWQEHLGLDRVGVHDVFFELGGNSLVGMAIVTRLERVFGTAIPAARLFEMPTVATLAALISGAEPEAPMDEGERRGARRRRETRRAIRRARSVDVRTDEQ